METSDIPLKDTLLPALVQCFGIILIGFILGKTKVLSQTQAQGLSVFVQYLSLPSLIFVTVSTIPLTQVKWEFIAAVFVSKASVFVCVCFASFLLTHQNNLGKTGIFALLATQSNDFALGYPLFLAMYQNKHPEFPIYLYIIAPIQLLILNTIGFFFLEMEKRAEHLSREENFLFHILKGTLKNPVVIMTIIGLIWNVTYGEQVLPIFDNILKAFSSAFPATALLLLGYTMTIKSEKPSSQVALTVTLLILTKCLLFPLILQKFTRFFLQNHAEEVVRSFSSFGFLYGVLPSAPSVYVFATQYETCVNVAAKTIIGSTAFSAPLMYATSSVISLTLVGMKNLASYLSITISYLSSINFVCSFLLLLIFFSGKRWKSVSFAVIFYFVFAQILTAVGGILLYFDTTKDYRLFYVQYILSTGSIYSTRLSTLLLSILLLIIRIRSLCYILRIRRKINIFSVIICFFVPYATAASLLAFNCQENFEPNFQLGFPQIVATFTITAICFIGTIACIIVQQMYLKKNKNAIEEPRYIPYQNDLEIDQDVCDSTVDRICSHDIEDIGSNFLNGQFSPPSIPVNEVSARVCDSRYHCCVERRIQCSEQLLRYVDENSEIGTGLIDDEYFFKHIILIVIFSVAMMLSLFLCVWKFMLEAKNGIYLELEFLDVILNYSLGIVCFIMFGLDCQLLNIIFTKLKFFVSPRSRNVYYEI